MPLSRTPPTSPSAANRTGVDALSLAATTANAILFDAFAVLAGVVALVGRPLGDR